MTLAAVPLLLLAALRGRLRVRDGATERRLALAGALLALHFATWIASLNYASVAISTLLVCTTPVWTEAYAVLRRRRIDPYAAASILGALAGVAIVVGAPDRTNTPVGIALALAGAVAIAAYLLVVRATDPRYDTLAVTARTYAYAAVVLVAASLLAHDRLPPLGDARAWGGIVAMALLSQLFGHTALNAAVRVLSATFVSTVTLLEPVIAAVLAAWLFAERLSATTAVGAVVILAAIGVALRGEQRQGAAEFGIDGERGAAKDSEQPLPSRTDVVMEGRGNERSTMAAAATTDLAGLRTDIEHAVEIVPGRWVDDDEIVALEQRYDILLFERFADGTLLVTPPAGWKSSTANFEMARQIADWIRAGDRGLGMDCSGGVGLPDGSLFAPDTTFVSKERWAAADHERMFAQVVPDATFEMISSSDQIRTTLKKVAAYLRNGVRLAVLIDPIRRHVYVGREGDAEPRDLGDVDSVDCSPVMPGFVLDVAAINQLR